MKPCRSQSGQWGGGYRDREKVKVEMVDAGKCHEFNKMRVNILFHEWHSAPPDQNEKPVLIQKQLSIGQFCKSLDYVIFQFSRCALSVHGKYTDG